jgi:hypothetical protein
MTVQPIVPGYPFTSSLQFVDSSGNPPTGMTGLTSATQIAAQVRSAPGASGALLATAVVSVVSDYVLSFSLGANDTEIFPSTGVYIDFARLDGTTWTPLPVLVRWPVRAPVTSSPALGVQPTDNPEGTLYYTAAQIDAMVSGINSGISSAAVSASNAAASASTASTAASTATNDLTAVSALLATFQGVFLGAFATDDAATAFATAHSISLAPGLMYENTSEDKFRIYSGTTWGDYDATAAASQSAAALSAASAAASASTATTQATNASTSASTASTQAGVATTQATNAASSATAAAGSATSASTSASSAATSASTASSAATNTSALLASFRGMFLGAFVSDAAAAASAAANSITLSSGIMYENTTEDKFRIYGGSAWGDYDATAAASQSAAALSATNAAASATAAAGSATAASGSASTASTQASNASTSASSASTSASTATTQASNAATSATNAANSATAAANSATAASGSASTATTQANDAAASAAAAAASAQTASAGQVNSDWNASSGVAQILNKPTLVASATTDTTNAGNIATGTLPAARLPAPTTSALGGVKSASAPAHKYQTGVDTSGNPTFAQPAAADITGLVASATTDTTNASNISSGTLPAARLPAPTTSALGGVKSATAPTHEYQTGVDTSGNPTFAQPAVADVSGALAASNNLSDVANIQTARQNMNVENITKVADANATLAVGKVTYAWTSLTAARTGQLPAANSYNPGQEITLEDWSGSCSPTKTITPLVHGADTLVGASTVNSPYGALVLTTDGVSEWQGVQDVSIGTSAGQAIALNSAGKLPAVDGSNLTNLAAPLSGITGLGSGIATALGIAIGTAGSPVVLGGAGGTPSSLNLSNATALPTSALVTGSFAVGFSVTAYSYTTGSITINPALGNYAYVTNNGAFTITAPAADCAVDLLVTNGASAGSITFSGFTVGSSTGSALTTTSGNKFIVSIRRINGVSTYTIYALQ